MAVNNFNEILKKREAEERTRASSEYGNAEIKLDDAKRVKVLSPGRLVAKRFKRNKLAIIGTCLLIFMFIFSFVGPLFYPYGQTDISYKFDYLNINYAAATERKDYTNYVLDDEQSVHFSVSKMMSSYAAKMAESESDIMAVNGSDGSEYVIKRLGDNVYTINVGERNTIATYGAAEKIGDYDTMSKKMSYSAEAPEGDFEQAVANAVAGKKTSFYFAGDKYSITNGATKLQRAITREASESLRYTGSVMDSEFEKMFFDSMDKTGFEYNGTIYLIIKDAGGSYIVCSEGNMKPAAVSSLFVFDSYEPGKGLSDEFKAQALLELYNDQKFTADGEDYTIAESDGTMCVYNKDNVEVAAFSTFSVRRFNGEDILPLDFKAQARKAIEELQETKASQASFMYSLPEMDENGDSIYDENGNLVYVDTEIIASFRLGQYVFNCEQLTHLIDIYAAPSSEHVFGTDADGYDILARMMYGGRISLLVGFIVVLLEVFLGVILGGIAGFFGGWIDTLIMRLVDIFYCIPSMPILIILGAMFDQLKMDPYTRLAWLMAILGFLGWASVARLVRGQILSLREQEFMTAAEATGISVNRRIFKHLLPNVMPQLIVYATMGLGSVIITESTLSFLGLGVKHPLATWGTMINSITSSNENLVRYAYIWIPVGLLICLTVIAFNFVGDGLRDAFDPKMKQ